MELIYAAAPPLKQAQYVRLLASTDKLTQCVSEAVLQILYSPSFTATRKVSQKVVSI